MFLDVCDTEKNREDAEMPLLIHGVLFRSNYKLKSKAVMAFKKCKIEKNRKNIKTTKFKQT